MTGDGRDARAPAHRVATNHLRPEQLTLLQAVLRAGDVPVEFGTDELRTTPRYANEVARALAWVQMDATTDADEDDIELPGRGPLVKPSRPPLADGRRQATRYRRLSAGLIDELVVGVPTITAAAAGAAPWTVAAIHLVYHVAPTTLYGWSIGKLWCGLRTVDGRTLRTPNPLRALLRWFVAYLPVLLSLWLGLHGDIAGLLVAVVYAPIMVDLRGLHDRAAGTRVMERSAAGPGLWVRHRPVAGVSARR